MKWYIEYPIIWIITILIYYAFFTNPNEPQGLRLLLTIILGTLISTGLYAGYKTSVKKKDK